MDEQAWVPASTLHRGSVVRDMYGHQYRVKHAWTRTLKARSYNLTVRGFHTYAVGHKGIWVHNCDSFGRSGTQFTSVIVVKQQGRSFRIDVENPNPLVRDGNIHLQIKATNEKFYYNPKTGRFDGLPRKLQKELENDPQALDGIKKALRMLGES